MLPAPKIIYLPGRGKPWRVTYREHGKRCTRHFISKPEAVAFAADIGFEERFPELAITTAERMLVARLREAASKAGVSIDAIADAAVDLARTRATKSILCPLAMDEWLEDCEGRNLRAATLRHYRQMVRAFCGGHKGTLVSKLTRQGVIDWITSRYLSEESRNTARTPLMVWLRWCWRQGYADPDRWREPLRWPVRLHDERHVAVLRPAVLRVLLRRLPERHRFPLALACLTGIRPAELTRMDWSMIDRRGRVIRVPGAVSKIREARLLQGLPDAVWRWVDWEVAAGRGEGRIMGSNYRNWREIIRKHMRGLGEWPHDATRHSFASYGYHYLGAERTVEIMGHIRGFAMFAKRYKGIVRAVDARLWFGCCPPQSSSRRSMSSRR